MTEKYKIIEVQPDGHVSSNSSRREHCPPRQKVNVFKSLFVFF